MHEETTWKAHTFTLVVFGGIAVLCSIFFILGFLMGRTQAQKVAANAAPAERVSDEAKAEPKEDAPDFTFYDSVKKEQPAVLEPPPSPPKPDVPAVAVPSTAKQEPAPERPAPVTSKPENVLNYQVSALRKSDDAEKLLDALKKKGFRAFILAPAAGDPNPLFRVQVGPFSDLIAAQAAKKKLEAAGYQPILKR